MHVQKVHTADTLAIERIIAIHDEMPLAWDPTHRVSKEYLSKLVKDIQSSEVPQGFWVLTPGEFHSEAPIEGLLWAVVKKNPLNERLFCSLNSFWIRPELRNQGLAPRLTEPALVWAREHGATQLVCSTHFRNSRMREVLEKQSFTPEMVSYSLEI